MWEWIQTWTFFNWLTLILIIPASLGYLNAYFGLRDRWKNRKATKSREAFDERVVEIERQIKRIDKYRKNPSDFFMDTLEKAVFPALSLIGIFALLLLAASEYLTSSSDNRSSLNNLFTILQINLALPLLIIPAAFLLEIKQNIEHIRLPQLLFSELASLLKDGANKGLLKVEHLSLLDKFLETDLLIEDEKEIVKKSIVKLKQHFDEENRT